VSVFFFGRAPRVVIHTFNPPRYCNGLLLDCHSTGNHPYHTYIVPFNQQLYLSYIYWVFTPLCACPPC
jgi:hypothetical protein